jgi:DNA repair protein SbcC/Rad50
MFGKIFNKNATPPKAAPEPAPPAKPTIDPQSLAGNDEALFAFLADEARHERRALAARLISDASLPRLVEWAKDHDRGVLRDAKDREALLAHQASVVAEADALLVHVQALATAAQGGQAVAANVLADLDRDWGKLDSAHIPTHTGVEFGRYREQLGDHSAQASDRMRAFQQQVAQLNQAAQFLEAAWGADTDPPYEVLAEAPAHVAGAALAATEAESAAKSVANALRIAAARLQRAAGALDEDLAKARKRDEFLTREAERESGNAERSRERWVALPVPLRPQVALRQATTFDDIVKRWAAAKIAKSNADKAAREAGMQRLKDMAAQLATAVSEGHVNDAENLVRESRKLLHDTRDAPDSLTHEFARLSAEAARLQGWQRWGAGVSREELIVEAEQLSMANLAPALIAKESKKLRERWQSLDKDNAASRDHWNRFDRALRVAYAPAKTFFDKEDERRKENLGKRVAICDEMQATIDGGLPKVGQTGFDWKPYANLVEGFVRRWRELGPAEHTLPRSERDNVPKRFQGLVDALEAPLASERGFERKRRELLIAEAKALSNLPTGDAQRPAAAPRGRDGDRRPSRPERGPSLADQSRALTAKWQERAKAMPLSRHDENALWQQFRGALDDAFAGEKAKGDAARASVNAETTTARALIQKWEELAKGSDVGALRDAVAASKREWNQLDKLPRDAERDLRRRADTAIAHMERQLKSLRQGAWGGQVNALGSVLKQRAAGAALSAEALPELLPKAWREAVQATTYTPAEAILTDLLKFELALQIPSPAEYEEARRRLQMTQLAEALKGGDRSTILDRGNLDAALVRLAKAPPEISGTSRVTAVLAKLAKTG